MIVDRAEFHFTNDCSSVKWPLKEEDDYQIVTSHVALENMNDLDC